MLLTHGDNSGLDIFWYLVWSLLCDTASNYFACGCREDFVRIVTINNGNSDGANGEKQEGSRNV